MKKIGTAKRTVVDYIQDKMDYGEAKNNVSLWKILREIKSVFELALDEDEHDYYIDGENLIICQLRSYHGPLLNGLSIIAREYIRNTQCLDLSSAIIEDYSLFLNNIDYLYTHQ